jgi:hypothetical protein
MHTVSEFAGDQDLPNEPNLVGSVVDQQDIER